MPLTDTGYRPYSITELRNQLRLAYENETGESPDWDQDDFLGAFSEAALAIAVLTGQGTQALYDAFKLDNAQGRFLENLCELVGVTRDEATASRVTLTLGGTSGTVVLAGRVVEGTSNNERWRLIEDVTVPGTGLAESETLGPVTAPIGSITRIITPVSGWTTVTNSGVPELGTNRETDGQLRLRRQRALQSGAVATIPAIQAAVEGLDFFEKAVVLSNPAETDLVVGAYTIRPHDVLILVDVPTLTAEEEDEFAQTLLNVLPATTNTTGPETVSTIYRGTTFVYFYAEPTPVSVLLTMGLLHDPNYNVFDVIAEAEARVIDYFSTLSIGDNVTVLGIYGALSQVEGLISVFSLNMNGGGPNDVVIADTEVAVYDPGSSYI